MNTERTSLKARVNRQPLLSRAGNYRLLKVYLNRLYLHQPTASRCLSTEAPPTDLITCTRKYFGVRTSDRDRQGLQLLLRGGYASKGFEYCDCMLMH